MKKLITLMLALFFGQISNAQQVIRLYEGRAPGSETWTWTEKENNQNLFNTRVVYNVSDPTLTAFLPNPSLATGTAIIIAPGGGFHTLSIDSEGIDVAKWLNAKGVAAFVLKYRLVESKTDDPVKEMLPLLGDRKKLDEVNAPVIPLAMQDGLTAVKYVRSHAKEFDIDPTRIGFIGFSAGGTVTMSVIYNATVVSRPNFVAPIYAYTGAVIGSNIPAEKTPIFIVAASDDQLGLAPHSIDFYNKWYAAKQPTELHMYERGGHGFGMRKQKLPTDNWIERFGDWMKMQGYLTKLRPQPWELQYTEEEIAAFQKAQEDRAKNDWGYLTKYQEENMKIGLTKAGENRVIFLGNSITEGWVQADPEFFSKNPYIGRGISGQTTPQMLVRFREDVLNLKPAVLVISAGINDIAENTGPYNQAVTLGNIISMAELAKANNIRVVLASVHPAFEFPWRKEITDVPTKIIQFNALLKDYALKNKLVYLDYHSAMKDGRNGLSKEMAEDGVHPTLAGYKIMEPLAMKAIAEALKQK